MIYPTLSLWQWWASLIAWCEKEYETRSWPTDYRGLMAIHAAKTDESLKDYARQIHYFREKNGPDAKFPEGSTLRYFIDAVKRQPQHEKKFVLADLPRGVVLCIVELQDVLSTDRLRNSITPQERAFGDWSPGRFAWKMRVVKVFDEPIPATGKQKIWSWEGPEVKAL